MDNKLSLKEIDVLTGLILRAGISLTDEGHSVARSAFAKLEIMRLELLADKD